ncbi:hypothetical protein DY218_29805 [Streptomyces triticagri]|uniref:Uncharacterized protein n=1 Tax=Streptomyces triticagri TaxID=2293568 RepID=A0A372LWI6_9ACTN|nr:hypothetical protein [Streptomyces triticagri]RFU83024.1 hypothetical protein DY218_29805 [Streptomyces triticagri]
MSVASHEGGDGGPSEFRVELESADGGTRRAVQVRAASVEEALVAVRDPDQWPEISLDDFRVVEVSEEGGSSEARHRRNARRRYLNAIVESGLVALGKSAPEPPAGEFADVVCDFFTRAVVLPGGVAFPAEETEAGQLLSRHDDSRVLAELLEVHFAHHGLKVARA